MVAKLLKKAPGENQIADLKVNEDGSWRI